MRAYLFLSPRSSVRCNAVSVRRSAVICNIPQGNLNPAILRSTKGGTIKDVESAVRKLLRDAGPQCLIANLGEGLRGDEDPELVAALVDFLHIESEAIIKKC